MLNKTYQLVRELFKNDKNEPLELSPGQVIIADSVFKRRSPDNKRNIHCITFTRYGKSLSVAIGALLRVSSFPEKWGIVAPDDKKAKIIMGYIIQHIFDNEYTKEKFRIDKNENLERIRRERSKNRLTFRVGDNQIGEIFILSAQQKIQENPLDALMGFGASNIIIDESSLIDNGKYAGILRMLGDTPDPFLFEIGNPFRRNHFFDTLGADTYYHILVDYVQGLEEGRITQEQVDRMRSKPFFDILYECKFPDSAVMDKEGWIPLLTYEELKQAKERKVQANGIFRMGCDVAEGGDANVIVQRCLNSAHILHSDHQADLMKTVGNIKGCADSEGIDSHNIFIDAIGDGAGVVARLRETSYYVNPVKNSEKAIDAVKFKNKKAETYWKLREWIRAGGCLDDDERWDELTDIKFRFMDSNARIEIISKRKLLSMGIPSPNYADALALTFDDSENHDLSQIDDFILQEPQGSY